MHLLLIRHGETEWNVQKRIQGWGNSNLSPLGLQQIQLLANRLSEVPITAIYSSDSDRARQTATTISGSRDIPLTVVAELRETSWGKWEGKTAVEISAAEPELWERFKNRDNSIDGEDQADLEANSLVPDGEPILHASRRINGAIERIVSHHQESDEIILVVGHGGSLRFVLADVLGLRPSDARRFHLDNASVTHIVFDADRSLIKLLNDTSHWSGALVL